VFFSTKLHCVTILGEIWSFGQLLYFATHAKSFSKYLNFNIYLSFTLLNFSSLSPSTIFGISALLTFVLSASFFCGWVVHHIIPLVCKRESQAFIAIGDVDAGCHNSEADNQNEITRRENERAGRWNKFKILLLKVVDFKI
jgi:hypothetical protein